MPAAYAAPPKQLHGALFSGQSTAQAAAAPSHAPPAAASQVGIPAHGYAAAPSHAPPAAPGIPAHGYAAEQNTRFREYMEDDRTVVEGFGGRADRLFAAVYDGHGGRLAVDFITARLHEVLAAELRASRDTDMQGCLSRAFLKTDRMLLQAGAFRVGSTAACCVFERDVALGRALLHTAKCAASLRRDRARHRKPCACSQALRLLAPDTPAAAAAAVWATRAWCLWAEPPPRRDASRSTTCPRPTRPRWHGSKQRAGA